MQRLQGKIAVVTGSSRGAGRGIALMLGAMEAPDAFLLQSP
jgi:NAD(P)-dependent dehydrogenase (short-subunit alcohol dehydrogenase family)